MKEELNNVLIIGGGIAGISSALELANHGHEVFLVERRPSIGGRMSQLDKTFPTLDCAICILAPKMVEVSRNPHIHLMTYSEIESIEGHENGFNVKIKVKKRYVDATKCTGCGICADHCPQRHLNDEFNEGLGERSAIYIPFPQAVPRVATIDEQHCLRLTKGVCGICEKKCPAGAIRFDDRETFIDINVKSIIIATGFDVYDGSYLARYGYGRFKNVITSLQYERMLNASGPTRGLIARPSDGRIPTRLGIVQCAGSRVEGCKSYCSKICCVYATKEAILTKEHLPESEILLFYNDLRTIGKGHEEFINRSKQELGIQYIPSLIGDVEEDEEQCVRIRYHDRQTDKVLSATVDLLILCPPIIPSNGTVELARMLDIDLDENGFVKTLDSNPVATTRNGIFVCGCARGPEDISSTVTDAMTAACAVTQRSDIGVAELKEDEEDIIGTEINEPRIGVFVCSCGMNIGAVVDVDEVVRYASTLPGVVFAEKCMYACSQDNQTAIQNAIRELKLNRILVAACSPRSHLQLFQDTCKRAGLNRNLVGFVSIRELDSWVHQHDGEMATEKAKILVRMGVANIALARPMKQIRSEVTHSAIVIGGGIAGMTAALSIASKGFYVYLVEKSDSLGGYIKEKHLKDLDGSLPQKVFDQMLDNIRSHKNIEVLTSTSIAAVSGSVGHFVVKLTRGGSETTSFVGDRIIEAGVIILATGAEPLRPEGTYDYGLDDRIVSQPEFERMLQEGTVKGSDIVEILCAGSREDEGRTYCSQICCEVALRDLLELKRMNPQSRVFVLYRDIRINGLMEKYYKEACELGITFVRFSEEDPPRIDRLDGLSVRVKDIISDDELLLRPDLVVLAVPLVPREDNKILSEMLKVPLSEDGFFLEAHPKLRPVDFSVDGIFVAGAAQYPKGIVESMKQGFAAASRALGILMNAQIVRDPTIAVVDQELCTGCARCIEACPYSAVEIRIQNGMLVAEVNNLLCKGCGACAAACPCRAITLHNFTNDQIIAQIDAALENSREEEIRGIAFLCHWCAYAGADNAGVSRFQYPPNILPIRVMCSGRIDPFHVLYALLKGSDGVFIGACHPGDCHYMIGNQLMKRKIDNLREMIKDYGFDPERVRVEWVSASEGRKFAEAMKEFVADLGRLGPNPLKKSIIVEHRVHEKGVT